MSRIYESLEFTPRSWGSAKARHWLLRILNGTKTICLMCWVRR